MVIRPSPRPVWRLPNRTLTFESGPCFMGILNVTPDSFSDGGAFHHLPQALAQAERLIADGADVLDVGGESTRPYSQPVSIEEEMRRVIPVVKALAREVSIPISVDTSKFEVARAGLEAGAEIINDVTGLVDPRMRELARSAAAGVCVMHMQGIPQTMQDAPAYTHVTQEIFEFLRQRRDALLDFGLSPGQICLDPGIGFGKTHAHNIQLMRECGTFRDLGCPVLVGHSRKGFLAKVLGDPNSERAAATAGAAAALALQGIEILRIHDVRIVREALQAFQACLPRSLQDDSRQSLHQPDDQRECSER